MKTYEIKFSNKSALVNYNELREMAFYLARIGKKFKVQKA